MTVRKSGLLKDIPISNNIEVVEVATKTSIVERKEVVNVNRSGAPYLLFHFDFLSNKYSLSIFNIMIVLYLWELHQFTKSIKVNGNTVNIGFLEKEGFIQKDFSASKDVYILSKLGKSLFDDFNSAIGDNSKHFSDNRETDMDIDSDLEDVLSRFL